MRTSVAVLGVALVLAACQETGKDIPVPMSPVPGGPLMTRENARNDFDFASAGHGHDSQTQPAAGVAIAIVEREFAPGEVAQTVREPGGDHRGVIVLSSRALDDHALFLGAAALDLDERSAASLTGTRVSHVWQDGRVTDASGAYVGSIDLGLLPTARTADILGFLRERSPRESSVEIPHLGPARLLRF
jgi:hypothetical protein